ncbi:rhodanese-like domain-containing protein, partial [Flavobacteriaceae bacterium]|nr:rhodanese-like domain-containing protein [Flavobacteriaceae bacterium]
FAPWVGALVKDIHQPILLVVPDNMEKETITRLSRVGFDNVLGYLSGGFETWEASGKEIDTLPSVSANVLEQQLDKGAFVFDVRRPGEYEAEHIENVPSTPLDFLNDHISEFPTNKDFYVHCAGGYRSVIAASILKARGYSKVIDIAGGYGAIKKTNIKRTQATACSNSK